MRPMQAIRRLKGIHAFNVVPPKPSNERQSPPRNPTLGLQIEFLTAMTNEGLDKRAETIRIKLRAWQIQSDMDLQQKQREANRAELQAVVQKQLRSHSGTLNSRSPPSSTNALQRPHGRDMWSGCCSPYAKMCGYKYMRDWILRLAVCTSSHQCNTTYLEPWFWLVFPCRGASICHCRNCTAFLHFPPDQMLVLFLWIVAGVVRCVVHNMARKLYHRCWRRGNEPWRNFLEPCCMHWTSRQLISQ
jgi:hypothetical protein